MKSNSTYRKLLSGLLLSMLIMWGVGNAYGQATRALTEAQKIQMDDQARIGEAPSVLLSAIPESTRGTTALPYVEIGNGTTAGTSPAYYMDFAGFWKSNRTQTLYLASELGGPKTITGLQYAFERVAPAPNNVLVNFTIKIYATTSNVLTAGSYYSATPATLVYSNASFVPATATGWANIIEIDDYVYDGTSNLIVEIAHGQTTYQSSYFRTYRTIAPVTRVLLGYSDTEHPAPYKNFSSQYSNVRFYYESDSPELYVSATALNNNEVEVNWTGGGDNVVSFDVWREKVYQPGALTNIGTTYGQKRFVDSEWETLNWGVYRWAVTANMATTSSEPFYSNNIEKNMNTKVNVTAALSSGDSPAGTKVIFTNTSEPALNLVYQETLGGTGKFTWNAFRRGVYNIEAFKNGFSSVSLTNVNIFDEMSFNWVLTEMLDAPTNLYVTPTGLATWQGAGTIPFEPFMESFDGLTAGQLPEGWTKSPSTAHWGVTTTTNAGGASPEMKFSYSPTATNAFYLKTPAMSTAGQSNLTLSFKNIWSHYSASYAYSIRIVAIANGTEYTIQQWSPVTASMPKGILTYDLTAAHGVGAADFQIAWVFDGNTFGINNWYIDDVSLMSPTKGPKSFQNYKVFHNGVFVTNTSDNQYQYGTNGEALVNGTTYTAEVATVYSTGQSTKAAYTWTYKSCGSYDAPGNFAVAQVLGTTNLNLTWTIPTIPPGQDPIEFARITRGGEVIAETDADSYLDLDLDLGSYTYCITFVYASGAETCPATLCKTVTVIGTGIVNGNVKEAAYLGGANIAGAEVTLSNSDNTYTFTTNASGNYTGEVVAGTYKYVVEAEGYVSQTLTNIVIQQTATVTHDFVLMEFPYAVGAVVATELNDNTVEVNWTGSGGGTGPGGDIAEWLYYDDGLNDDGIGGPASFTWAIKFDPAQLTDYAGTKLTKISIYNRLSSPMILRICEGNNAATQVLEQTLSGLPIEQWAEVTLTTPVTIDVTKQLWITVYSADGANYPAAVGIGMNQPNGDLITLDGTTWDHLTDYELDGTWNLRGFVTDMRSNRTMELVRTANTTVYDSNPVNTTFAVSGKKNTSANANINANTNTRALKGFNVYRTTCADGGNMQMLGYTLDSIFSDNTWTSAAAGTYKWAVEAVYDQNNSAISFSNCLDKNMITAVSVKVNTNSGDSPEGTKVTFTNTSEPDLALVYNVTLDGTGYFAWDEFRKGTYDIYVQLNAFAPIEMTGEVIDGPKNFVFLLEELLTPVVDLHVSPTGYATWRDGGIVPFEPVSFNFEADAQGWEIQNNVNGWQWGSNAALSSQFMNFDGNSTNFIAVNADAAGSGGSPIVALAKSPVMNLENADHIFMSFDYKLKNDKLRVHYSINGAEPVQFADLPASATSWKVNHMIELPAEALVENVQIIFAYTEASSWSYGASFDNVVLTDIAPDSRSLENYKVWLDGEFIIDTPNTFYQYDPAILTPGQVYFSEVAAFYSNGMSEKMNYTWTYVPCDSFPSPQDLAYEIINETDVKLSWAGGDTPPPPPPGDGFSDDFESYTNFAIDFAPWTNVDVDGSGTYGMNGIDWLNEYAAQAFIIFNPSATSPALDGTPAHSGNKFAACFASEAAPNNDWLMSPKVTIGAGYKVSFWAKSYTADYGLERFKVGVSTTGLLPANFTTISPGSYVSAPAGDWTLFTYDLAAYVGQDIHVGINCVSNDAFFLMVDDFSIGATTKQFASNSTSPVIGSGITGTRETRTQMEQNAVANADPARAQLLVDSQNYSGSTTVDRAADILWGANWEDPQASENGIVSTYFGGISAPTYTADDFVVPAGKSWVVSSLWARGFVSAGLPAPQGFGYTIFADANGKPGAVLHEKTNAGANNPDLVKIDLETPVTLTEGKYWVSIYAYYATATGTAQGRWNQYMWNPSPAVENPAMLSDLANLFGGTNGFESLISLGVAYSALDFAVVGEETGGGSGGGEIPEGVIGANVYRDGLLIAEMVQGTTYTDAGVEPGVYDYCVTFVYEGNAESCAGASCVEVSLEEDCIAPVNLTAELSTDKTKIILEWNKDNFEGAYLSYGSLTYSDAIGVGGAALTAAIQLDPAMLAPYDGRVFSKIKMYYGTGPIGNVTIQIWEGTTLVREQAITGTVIGEAWNEFTFNQPLLIDGTKSYKVGYTVADYSADGFPGGAQDYMGNPNSDVIFFNGAWDHLNNYLPYSWLIEAYVSSAGKEAYDDVVLTSNVMSDATNSTLVSAPSVDLSRGDVGRSTRAFMGYNVYRGGTLLNSQLVPTNYYEDIPPAVANYCYTVTAVYSLCGESDPSNQVCIDFHVGVETNDLSNVKVYPNPSNSILNIDLTDNVSQVVIYNFLGQVVYENNVTDDTRLKVNVSNYESGAYLVKFITNEGRTMTKKVVVTK